MIRAAPWLVGAAICLIVRCAAAGPFDACATQLPFGAPAVPVEAFPHVSPLCRHFYAALHDNDLKEPVWVAWRLNRAHSLGAPGCLPRKDHFRADPDLPRGARAELADYEAAGPDGEHYSRGHMANSDDFRFDAVAQDETFLLSNMLPQLQGNNAGIWLSLENAERAWAVQRGDVWIIAGGVPGPERLGPDQVAIPTSFWKVVVDLKRRATIGFMMRHQAIPQGDLTRFITPIADIEEVIGFTLPLPPRTDRNAEPSLWPLDLMGWRTAHQAACPGSQ